MWSAEPRVRQLLIERVRYMRQREDLERGRRRAEEIEAAWKTMLARKPEPEMAESLRRQLFRLQFNLANILRDLAEFQKSRSDGRGGAEQDSRSYLGEDHLHTLQTRAAWPPTCGLSVNTQAALELDLETYQVLARRIR